MQSSHVVLTQWHGRTRAAGLGAGGARREGPGGARNSRSLWGLMLLSPSEVTGEEEELSKCTWCSLEVAAMAEGRREAGAPVFHAPLPLSSKDPLELDSVVVVTSESEPEENSGGGGFCGCDGLEAQEGF